MSEIDLNRLARAAQLASIASVGLSMAQAVAAAKTDGTPKSIEAKKIAIEAIRKQTDIALEKSKAMWSEE